MSIKSNLEKIQQTIPEGVKLVAVSKFHPESSLLEAYDAGQKVFGENRVQELDLKQANLPRDIEWHLIGHLQKNKIKKVVPYVHTIQSIDSWELLAEVNKYAEKVNRVINCLLEIHIANEDSKFGFSFDECRSLLDNNDWENLHNVQITGVMGMATYTDNTDVVRQEFKSLKLFFDELKEKYFKDNTSFSEVSMGMSQDYQLAIEEGATIVRIGSSIFGTRQ